MTTSHITLRDAEEQHAAQLFALINGSRDVLGQWLPWVENSQTEEQVREFLQLRVCERRLGASRTCLIDVDGQIAGVCDLHGISHQDRRAAIGYWLADTYVGRGILPQALQQLLTIAYRELGLHRTEIITAAANLRSCAVAERMGFQQEGVLRGYLYIRGRHWDARIYSQLASEWDVTP
ncbi:GNAT family N-acetyltransferase [Vogesella oryzae]|uniref:GNAT family N-acetyltransferase n=1 Tax=Vogesella oryzae TaxID=1735285 RepID=UPI001583BC46|nr:GNAT family protein [Vogesella oryzae]